MSPAASEIEAAARRYQAAPKGRREVAAMRLRDLRAKQLRAELRAKRRAEREGKDR